MLKHYFYLILLLLFLSCTKINYVGNSYDPTFKIEVFVDEGAIKRKYDVVGKGYVRSVTTMPTPEKIQTKAVEKAKQKGADAILIKDYLVPSTGINTTVRTDSVGKGVISIGNTTVKQASSPEFVVLFLKYTE